MAQCFVLSRFLIQRWGNVFCFQKGQNLPTFFPSPTERQIKRKTKRLKEPLLYEDYNTQRHCRRTMVGHTGRPTFFLTKRASNSKCKHLQGLLFLYYNPRTKEVLQTSWFFFRPASHWGTKNAGRFRALQKQKTFPGHVLSDVVPVFLRRLEIEATIPIEICSGFICL